MCLVALSSFKPCLKGNIVLSKVGEILNLWSAFLLTYKSVTVISKRATAEEIHILIDLFCLYIKGNLQEEEMTTSAGDLDFRAKLK